MSLSAGSEVKQTTITTPKVNGNTGTKTFDAPEDREILGLYVRFREVGTATNFDAVGKVYLGSSAGDNLDTNDNVGDGHSLFVMWEAQNEADDTNGHGNVLDQSGTVDVPDPIEWDEHQSLTVEIQEASGNQGIAAEVGVFYRER